MREFAEVLKALELLGSLAVDHIHLLHQRPTTELHDQRTETGQCQPHGSTRGDDRGEKGSKRRLTCSTKVPRPVKGDDCTDDIPADDLDDGVSSNPPTDRMDPTDPADDTGVEARPTAPPSRLATTASNSDCAAFVSGKGVTAARGTGATPSTSNVGCHSPLSRGSNGARDFALCQVSWASRTRRRRRCSSSRLRCVMAALAVSDRTAEVGEAGEGEGVGLEVDT